MLSYSPAVTLRASHVLIMSSRVHCLESVFNDMHHVSAVASDHYLFLQLLLHYVRGGLHLPLLFYCKRSIAESEVYCILTENTCTFGFTLRLRRFLLLQSPLVVFHTCMLVGSSICFTVVLNFAFLLPNPRST